MPGKIPRYGTAQEVNYSHGKQEKIKLAYRQLFYNLHPYPNSTKASLSSYDKRPNGKNEEGTTEGTRV
jgi:hypothetical protein